MEVAKEYELVVIGSGILGATVFNMAVKQGINACIIDKGRFSSAATASSGGLVRIIHDTLDMTLASSESFSEVSSHSSFKRTGALYIDKVENIYKRVKEVEQINKKFNFDLKILPPSELINFSDRFYSPSEECAAIYEPYSGYLNPYELSTGLINEGIYEGGTPMEYVEVNSIVDEKKIAEISTSAGKIYSSNVFLATGAWTKELMSKLGGVSKSYNKAIHVYHVKKNVELQHPIVVDDYSDIFIRPDIKQYSYVGYNNQTIGIGPDYCKPKYDESMYKTFESRLSWFSDSKVVGSRFGVDSYCIENNLNLNRVNNMPHVGFYSGLNGAGVKFSHSLSKQYLKSII